MVDLEAELALQLDTNSIQIGYKFDTNWRSNRIAIGLRSDFDAYYGNSINPNPDRDVITYRNRAVYYNSIFFIGSSISHKATADYLG